MPQREHWTVEIRPCFYVAGYNLSKGDGGLASCSNESNT